MCHVLALAVSYNGFKDSYKLRRVLSPVQRIERFLQHKKISGLRLYYQTHINNFTTKLYIGIHITT